MIFLKYKNIYSIKYIPLLSRIYKYCYDNKSLSTPKTIDGIKTPIKFILKYIFKYFNQYTKATVHSFFGKVNFFINLKNTQYHAIYFNKFREGYEPDILSLINILLPIDGTFCDIGSNWGIFSLYSLLYEKNSRTVFAFDAQRSSLKDLYYLKKQLPEVLNKLSIFNAVLSSANGEKVSLNSKDSFHSGLFGKVNSKRGISLKTTTLDSFLLEKVDLIKVDVEGMEEEVILGAKETIKCCQPYLILENPKSNKNSLIKTLNDFNYICFGIYVISKDNYICNLTFNSYSEKSIEKNILCIPKMRYNEFNSLISKFEQ